MLELPHAPSAWADVFLVCPCCKEGNLHHDTIEVFNRDTEDAATGLHVTIADQASIDTKMTGNPSRRRDGMLISFTCEHCTATPRMALIQHKGATYLHWLPGSEVGTDV